MGARRLSLASGKRVAIAAAGAFALAAGLIAVPASADTIEVPIAEVAAKGEPGSLVAIGSTDVDADLQGRSCAVAVVVQNQVSAHPGNTLVITSGDSRIEVPDIEATANGVTEAAGTLTLGETINVGVMLGNANITSLGSSLTVTCEPLPETPPPPPVSGEPPYTG